MTRHYFSDNDVSRQREINSRVERITGSIPTSPNRHKESPVSESGSSEYSGYFKVIQDPDDSTKIKIIDGALPTSGYAGLVDILGAVPPDLTPSVSLARSSGELYANAKVKDEDEYEIEFSYVAGNAYFHIATITSNSIIQRWTGGTLYYASRYIV